MGRTKGLTNQKSDNTTEEPKETKRRGRQPGQKVEREPAIIIPLDKNYRIRWDKLNKTLQEKSTKQEEIIDDGEIEEEAGWKSLGHFSSFKYLGKRYTEELTRKKILKDNKDGVTDINKLIEVVSKTEDKVEKLFKQLDVKDTKLPQ